MKSSKRIFSGVQPTGKLHIGNYLGAISQWLDLQENYDCIFCVVDLHTLSIPTSMTAKQRHDKIRELVALYVACGIDPNKATIFVQSHIKEHCELTWILNCVTPLGWLQRMTQYKDKSQKEKSIGTGLLDYPVLMAADILLYDTDMVPVGHDQKQHFELACDIAIRFNNLFGQTFKIPNILMKKQGQRIMGLDNPANKMSKSEEQRGHSLGLLDEPKTIKKAIMSAKTDCATEINFEQLSPAIDNLLTIYQSLSGESLPVIKNNFAGKGYGFLKKQLVEVVNSYLQPIQHKYKQIIKDPTFIDEIIKQGEQKALPIAQNTMEKIKNNIGLG